MLLDEAEKLYNSLAELFVREVVNEGVSKQSTGTLPALPLEEGRTDDEQDLLVDDRLTTIITKPLIV
jgi:hypothetical protein